MSFIDGVIWWEMSWRLLSTACSELFTISAVNQPCVGNHLIEKQPLLEMRAWAQRGDSHD